MSKIKFIISILLLSSVAFSSSSKMSYWDTQKRGANLFNSVEKNERFQAAKDFGIQFVRIAPNKWLNGRPEKELGDFLIGRPGSFKSIDPNDTKYLIKKLDEANVAGLKVIITMLSLPNNRWKQHNQDVEERGVWQSFEAAEQAFSFWRQLAQVLKGHPAVVGYNIRNEPSPELLEPRLEDWFTGDYSAWYQRIKGTPADLNLFYKKAIKAIREVDSDTPIVLDTGFYATAWGIKVMDPVEDPNVLYSFHMYEPYSYNSQFNKGKYKYPGEAPIGELKEGPTLYWDRDQLEKYLKPVLEWQKKYSIPSNRLLVGEVGVFRVNVGAEEYLKDITSILNGHKWHWAFYSFREDTWAGMDYELGTKKPNWKYWDAIEHGRIPGSDVYKPNPLSKILRNALKDRP